jgi:integration host factor subunit beta
MNRTVSKEFTPSMTKRDLVKVLSKNQRYLASKDVEVVVKSLINILSNSLSSGERIEIRGFGSFNLHYHSPRIGKNPRTGEPVNIPGKYVPHFKPGKELRKRVQ